VEEWGEEWQRWAYNKEGWREKEGSNPSFPARAPLSPACTCGANFFWPPSPALGAPEPGCGETGDLGVSPDAGGGGGGGWGGGDYSCAAWLDGGAGLTLACTPWAWLGQKNANQSHPKDPLHFGQVPQKSKVGWHNLFYKALSYKKRKS
jgi:hypothetical protein